MTGRFVPAWLARVLHDAIRFVAQHIELFLISGLIMVAAIQYAVRPQSQSYDEIQQSGVLRVLISDDPDAQYLFGKQHYGFEYELLAAFARSLDVELKLEVVPFGELFSLLNNGVGDLAVGGIINTAFVRDVCQPSIPWYEAKTTVVYKRGTDRPKNLEELGDSKIQTSARYFGMSEYEFLNLVDDHRSEYQLLSAVANGSERFVFTTNYRASNAKHYLPDLNRGFI
ncbi:MAG: transporter substrate-binding domain-containing protein, partial [Arenicella sp.]|nr:transporter substrate-binding domain-containing protein [Arenicella sp.]